MSISTLVDVRHMYIFNIIRKTGLNESRSGCLRRSRITIFIMEFLVLCETYALVSTVAKVKDEEGAEGEQDGSMTVEVLARSKCASSKCMTCMSASKIRLKVTIGGVQLINQLSDKCGIFSSSVLVEIALYFAGQI